MRSWTRGFDTDRNGRTQNGYLNMLRIFLKAFWQNRMAAFGLLIVLAIIFCGILAPWLAPHDPMKVDLRNRLAPPGGDHFLGTDGFGRDVMSRIIWGTRVSLQVGIVAVSVSSLLGIVLGLFSGYYGGWIDSLIMRLVDIMLSFPTILLALAIMAALGSSLTNVMIAVGITLAPRFARLVRGSVLTVRELDYIHAARALGMRDMRIIFLHIFPNVTAPIIIMATVNVAYAILAEASLSFLGLGVRPPTPTWGAIISDGRSFLDIAPWISLFSGFVIMIAVLGFNLFGDGLRDALDPTLRSGL